MTAFTPMQFEACLATYAIIDRAVLSQQALNWLRAAGVSLNAASDQDVAIIDLSVRFDDRNGLFVPDENGRPAIVIVPSSYDYDVRIADMVAFDRDAPSRFASLTGDLFALGEGSIDNPATYFAGQSLRLHRTPLDWLRGGCVGAVILNDEPWAIQGRFAGAPLVDCPDVAYGVWFRDQFRGATQRPLIRVPLEGIAA